MTMNVGRLIEAVERRVLSDSELDGLITRNAGGFAFNGCALCSVPPSYVSCLDGAVKLIEDKGWPFSFQYRPATADRRAMYFAWVFEPGTEDQILAHCYADTAPRALVLAYLHALSELDGSARLNGSAARV